MVLPLPGGPTSSRWWPPAAAISKARLPWPWPFTSARSRPGGAGCACVGWGGRHRGRSGSASWARAPGRSWAPHTRSPSTKAASAALPAATSSPRAPSRLAAKARASTPRIGRRRPSSPSSAALQIPSMHSAGIWSLASRRPRAMGRSKAGPSLRRSAGARLTTTRFSGIRRPLLRRAARTRSRDSWTAASARPTICSPGKPGPMSTSTRTATASTPLRAPLWQWARAIGEACLWLVSATPVPTGIMGRMALLPGPCRLP